MGFLICIVFLFRADNVIPILISEVNILAISIRCIYRVPIGIRCIHRISIRIRYRISIFIGLDYALSFIIDSLVMVSRHHPACQIFIHLGLGQFIPCGVSIYVGPIAVTGIDNSGNIYITTAGIQCQGAPSEADGHFTIQCNGPSVRPDQAVISLPVRGTIDIHMSKIST